MRLGLTQSNRRRGRFRNVWFAAGLLVLCALGASACGGPGRAAVPSSTAPAGHPSTVTPTPGYEWSAVDDLPVLGGGPSSTIASVLPPSQAGGTWMAAGDDTNLIGGVTATAWTSPDAVHWKATSLGPPGVNSQIRAATQWGSRQLAVGTIGTGPTQRAAVWLSAGPGQPLLPVQKEQAFSAPVPTAPLSGDAADAGAQMNSVATGALGIFASGSVDGQLAMWYSSDGSRWTRLSGAERVINAAAQPAVNALLVAANGVWAVGSVHNGTQSNAAVWTSTDGIHWYRVTSAQSTFAADGDRFINSIATLGTGFVAVGGVRTGSQWLPASWISPDGVSWSQPSEAFPEAPRPATDSTGTTVSGVTDDLGVGLVAVGGSPSAQRVWTSTDGRSWSEVPLPSNAADATDWHLGLVAALGTTTVVADNTVGAPRLLVNINGAWREVTADSAAFGVPAVQASPASLVSDGGVLYLAVNLRTRSQKLGGDTSSAAVLSSTDGTTWRVDAQGGVFAGHQIHALLAVQTGLLAAGASVPGPSGAPSAAVWSSPDGLDWRSDPAADGAFGGATTAAASTPSEGATTTSGSTRSGGASGSGSDGTHPTTSTRPAATRPPSTHPAAPTRPVSTRPAPTHSVTAASTPSRARLDNASIAALARVGPAVVALGQAGTGPAAAFGQPLTAPAAGWIDDDGTWRAQGPLDPQPSLATEVLSGACAGPQSVVAVGASLGGSPGSQAAAWVSDSGRTWQSAAISPTPSSGASEGMSGCLSTGNGYLAYGTAPGPAGSSDPALWQSQDGTTWTRQTVTAFEGSNGGSIEDLALQGTTWLATSGGTPPGGLDTPTAATASCVARLWHSGDAGMTWDALDTTSAPWTASLYATASLVGFVATNPIVVGTANGQLAVWEGSATSPSSGNAP